jgi:hypothetical protein
MLLFVDESGHDGKHMPYEVLAGVVVREDNLWNLVKAIRSAEREHFGDYLRNLVCEEVKAKKLLKRKRFRFAERDDQSTDAERVQLAHSLLLKGKKAHESGASCAGETQAELVAYSKQVIAFVHEVLNIAAGHNVQIIASVVDVQAPRPEPGMLRKDYVYLFERYFYLLEACSPSERGLVVFDELDKASSHVLIQQMAIYFLQTSTGRYRSSRIVPEPFFVHSDLTTGVFLADLAAYILGWGWRLNDMTGPVREEIVAFAKKVREMQFRGEKPRDDGAGNWRLYGIKYLDDLRGQADRSVEPEEQY